MTGASVSVMCLLLWAVWHVSLMGGFPNKARERDAVKSEIAVPLRIQPLARPLFSRESPEAVCIRRMLQEPPSGPFNISYCCHLLRLYGLEAFRHPRFASGRDVLNTLTDQTLSKTFFGEPIFFQTRSGIRYRDPAIQKIVNGENHRDICVASFAELSLPLSTPMTMADGAAFSLADLLRDSVENFDIKQSELAWTAVAYALYLPPQRGWTNRYGESFTFDDLANALMQTPLHKASCGGTHLLYALTVLWRADASVACLSESVREALARYLQQQTTVAVRSQAKEGYWTVGWYAIAEEESEVQRIPLPDTPSRRLLATGHLLEWLEMLPVEFQPAPDVYRRAASWLCTLLGRTFERSSIKDPDDFCPCVHAICAVRRLIGKVGE
jgi:hypothetical protein